MRVSRRVLWEKALEIRYYLSDVITTVGHVTDEQVRRASLVTPGAKVHSDRSIRIIQEMLPEV